MNRFLPVLLLLLAPVLRASEPLGIKTGARGTVGTGGYVGRGAYLQFGDVWKLKGTYSDYAFDGSTGTTRTAALRGSYQGPNLSIALNASVTPRNDAYANRSFGADGAWTFLLDESDEPSGLEEAELGAFWTQTRHSQIVPATPVLPDERNVIINQHDLGLSGSLTGWDLTLSLDAFRSLYDQDFEILPAAVRRRPRLTETAALVNGFPEKGASARLEWARWTAVTPYVGYAVTRYKIQPQPNSATSTVGAALRRGGFGLDLYWELVRQKASPDSKYFGFSGSFRF
ncbi:MAG: hypothetical protein M0D55_12260 [Elusimicrobiota bacterium]|nr:MAG: hypothetical protein M0D55_12260 [Elusimicrobiota bacterium]